MSPILMALKLGMNGIGFLSTYFSIGDYKIYPTGFLIGIFLIIVSIAIPEDLKK